MSGSLASNNLLTLVRADLAGFGGYSSARTAKLTGNIWLNANEAAWTAIVLNKKIHVIKLPPIK